MVHFFLETDYTSTSPTDYTSPLKINTPAFMTLSYRENCKDSTLPMFWMKSFFFFIISIWLQGYAFGFTKKTNPVAYIIICLFIVHLFYQAANWIQGWIQVRQLFLCYLRPSDVPFPFQDTTSHYTVTFSTLGLPVAVMVSWSFQVLNDLDCLEAAMKRILFISFSQALFDGFLMIESEF